MGRHSAGSRAGVDPIVAAALSQRARSVEPPQPRPAPDLAERDLAESQQGGGLGWPGEPGEGSGLGWPDDTTADDTTGTDPTGTDTTPGRATAADVTAIDPTVGALPATPAARDGEPSRRRFGWRRWFGGGPALPPAPSGSNAA